MNRTHTVGFAGPRRIAVALICLGVAGCQSPFWELEDETVPAALEVRAENERLGTLEQELHQLRNEFDKLLDDFQKFKKEFE